MKRTKFKFERKQQCPCGRSIDFQPICGSTQGGKCWSQKCGQQFFAPEPGYDATFANKPNSILRTQETSRPSSAKRQDTDEQLQFLRQHIYYQDVAPPTTDDVVISVPYMKSVVFQKSDGKVVYLYNFHNGDWIKGLNGKPTVPYKLRETLTAISEGRIVLIVEGEKDVETAIRHGFAATTNMLGAGKWNDDHSTMLTGIRAVIIPDNDDAGREHAQKVAASLIQTKACLQPIILDLISIMPDLPVKGDLSDYLELGGSIDKLNEMIYQLQNTTQCEVAQESSEQDSSDNDIAAPIPLPAIDYSSLPSFIAEMIDATQGESHKVALLASILAVCSAMMPTVHFTYGGKDYYPMLYVFVVGQAASGKSCINPSLKLIQDILQSLDKEHDLEQKDFASQLHSYEQSLNSQTPEQSINIFKEKPEEPIDKRMLIHADSTAPVVITRICDAASSLIFDTEADSLRTALGEFGDISSALRKCWEHEPIGKERKTSKRTHSTDPKLAMVIAGTYKQAKPLVKHVENGLLSRIAFVEILPSNVFQDKFAEEHNIPKVIAEQTAPDLLQLWEQMKNRSVKVIFTQAQRQRFNEYYYQRYSDEFEGISKDITTRSAIITLRMATILSVLNYWQEHACMPSELQCNDLMFETAMKLAEYCRHVTDYMRDVISPFNKTETPQRRLKPGQLWFQQLPQEFTTSEAMKLGEKLEIPPSTVYRWLKDTSRFTVVAAKRYRKYHKTIISQNMPP